MCSLRRYYRGTKMQRTSFHLILLGVVLLFNHASPTTVADGAGKAIDRRTDSAEPIHDELNTVFDGIKTPESKSLLKDLLGNEPADKLNFLQRVKNSFFVKLYSTNKENKDAKDSSVVEINDVVQPVNEVSTSEDMLKETTLSPSVTDSSLVTTFSPVSIEESQQIATEDPVVTSSPPWDDTFIPISQSERVSADCKFRGSNGTPPKNFITDVLGNWLNRKQGSLNNAVSPDTIKRVFVSEIRKQFPKEILSGLGLGQYVRLLFAKENNLGLDETLTVFSQMYTDVLGKLGLETTEFEPNSSMQIEADAKSNKLWAKIGKTTVSPFLEETFPKSCLKNEKSLPGADSAMKLILELPLDITNGFVSRSDNIVNKVPLVFDDQMNSAELFSKINAFVNSLPPEVMDEVVADYAAEKRFINHVDYEELELLAKQDLVEYVAMLSLAPTEDLTNYFTDSIKDGLYFTFSLSSIDDSIGSIPGLRELIDRIMQIPTKYLKLLVKKASIIIKKTFKLFAKVDFFRNKVDLFKNRLSKPVKMLSTLPFESTYDMYSANKNAIDRSDTVHLTTEQSEESLKSFLGLDDYNLSYDAIVSFLTEFAQLSNDAALAVFDDLSVRLNPFSGIARKAFEKEQRVTKRINDLYEKYDIANASKRLSNKLLSFVGLDEKSFNVTTTPAPPSFFEILNTELKRFPDNLLLNFRNPFSWEKNTVKTAVDKADVIVPDESLSAKDMMQVFYSLLDESEELEKKQKLRLVEMLSTIMKPYEKQSATKKFSSGLYELGYWFGNTTHDVLDELTNWWSGGREKGGQFMDGIGSSFNQKIDQIENMKRLFMEQNGLTNLSQKGRDEVHKTAKSVSSLVNWNKPINVNSFSNARKTNVKSLKYSSFVDDGIDTPDHSSKMKVNEFETLGIHKRSDHIEPEEFIEEIQGPDMIDLVARYKMLNFPVTLINNVKKQLLTAIKESESKNRGSNGEKKLSKWDKLRKKFGYPDVHDSESISFRVRRALPEAVLMQPSTEANIELELFLSQSNAKDIVLQYLTEEELEKNIPGDSVVAIISKFFNIR